MIRRFDLLIYLYPLAQGVVGRGNGAARARLMRTFRLLRRWQTIFFVPTGVLAQVGNPVRGGVILLHPVRRCFRLFSFSDEVELTPIKDPIVEVIFQSVSVSVRFIPAVGVGLTCAHLLAPKDAMGAFCRAPVKGVEVIHRFDRERLIWDGRLHGDLCAVMHSPFIDANCSSTIFFCFRRVAFKFT